MQAAAKLEELEEQAASVEKRLADAQAAYDASARDVGHVNPVTTHGKEETAELRAAQEAYDAYNAEVEKYTQLQEEANSQYEFYLGELERLHDQMEKVEEQPKTFSEAVTESFGSVQEDLDSLIREYDEVYERARSSIDGQIGLFATMKTETSLSVAEMQEAFASQIEYINLYTENLQKAAQYGINEGLIQSLSDGSAESAGYLNAIIQNIENLEAQGGSAAQDFVDDFNASFEEVETAKDEFAETVAQMETDFDERMTDIENRLTEGIENMNQEADAAEAARATIEAYTQAIRDGEEDAIAAAQAVARGVSKALQSSGGSGAAPSVEGNASGTTDAADVFIAGEEGPELIIGHRGATVFPADETERIIQAVDNREEGTNTVVYIPPEPGDDTPARDSGGSDENTRKIVLELDGKGSIEVGGNSGASTEQVVAILYEYLKPVLTEIISEEIFEEGDRSYEY